MGKITHFLHYLRKKSKQMWITLYLCQSWSHTTFVWYHKFVHETLGIATQWTGVVLIWLKYTKCQINDKLINIHRSQSWAEYSDSDSNLLNIRIRIRELGRPNNIWEFKSLIFNPNMIFGAKMWNLFWKKFKFHSQILKF